MRREITSKKDVGLEDFFVQFDQSLADNGMLDDYLYLQELRERRLYIDDSISDETVSPIIKAILRYNREDFGIEKGARKPISLYINTFGGSVESGYRLMDAILQSKTPVHTINIGVCYSMGFLIYITGAKRYATQNSTFLLHDGTTIVGDSSGKARDRMEFNDRIEERLRNAVLSWTNITKDQYTEHSRKEWYMFADEARQLGVVDSIVGVDCDIDEIL